LGDQFAFGPTGSTTAALITLLSIVMELLETHQFIHLITFDFSKAFNTVGHAPLMSQLSSVGLSDQFYNWMLHFLSDRSHTTKFQSVTSPAAFINAGVVQGSAIGPATFSLCVASYRPKHSGNRGLKYADDFYLIVPSSNSNTISEELDHIQSWASSNNLRLNPSKSTELIVKKPYNRSPNSPTVPSLPRVTSFKVLGVALQSNLSMAEHVNNVVIKAGQMTYALKLVKTNGLPLNHMSNIACTALFSSITYASPAWVGFANEEELRRLQGPIKRAHKWGLFSSQEETSFRSLCDKADLGLFSRIVSFAGHVLHFLLPPLQSHTHNLRPRNHSFSLPLSTSGLRKTFIHRMIFKTSGVKLQ